MFLKLSTAGLTLVLCHSHSTTTHSKTRTCSKHSSQHSSFLKLLTRHVAGSTHCWLSAHCCSINHHLKTVSFWVTFRMLTVRKCPNQKATQLTHLMHWKTLAQTLSAGTSMLTAHHGCQTVSTIKLLWNIRENSLAHCGMYTHSSCCMLILINLTIQNTLWNMTNCQ